MGVETFAMSSVKYKIDNDSVNFGGTENSLSTKYSLSDTFGEIGTGFSSSSNYSVYAGYRTLQGSYISISTEQDVNMPNLSGLVADQSNASGTWLVKTDNSAGYGLSVKTLTSPALKSPEGASFSDYSPVVSNTPDYTFTVSPTESNFAFSPEGQDISLKYLDDGSTCGTGSLDTQDKCWDGFSTSEKVISSKTSSNHPNGSTTTMKFRAAIGTNKIQDAGSYTTTIIITAITL